MLPNLQFIAGKRAIDEFREFHLNATIQLDNYHEMAALMRLAESLGADSMRLYMIQNTGEHLAPDYAHKNVGHPNHLLHRAFLETLRDPILGTPIAHLYDVASWRTRALKMQLPSDDLSSDYDREELGAAIRDAAADAGRRVALCAAGRIRFPDDPSLIHIEAQGLEDLGFARQAQYRASEYAARGGEAISRF